MLQIFYQKSQIQGSDVVTTITTEQLFKRIWDIVNKSNPTPIYSDNYNYTIITKIFGTGGEYLVNNQPWKNIEYSQGDYYITNKKNNRG